MSQLRHIDGRIVGGIVDDFVAPMPPKRYCPCGTILRYSNMSDLCSCCARKEQLAQRRRDEIRAMEIERSERNKKHEK